MLLLVLCLCQVSPTDAEFRRYFDHQESLFEKQLAQVDKEVAGLDSDIRGEPNPRKKELLQTRRKKLVAARTELEKERFRPKPALGLPTAIAARVEVGDIGLLMPAKVYRLVDGVPVLRMGEKYVIVDGYDSKELRPLRPFVSKDFWRVKSVGRPKEYEDQIPNPDVFKHRVFVVEPIKAFELEKAREAYDADRKAAKP